MRIFIVITWILGWQVLYIDLSLLSNLASIFISHYLIIYVREKYAIIAKKPAKAFIRPFRLIALQ